MRKEYSSTGIFTSNEDGRTVQEVEITYRNGWIRNLRGLPERKETYVGRATVWYNKDTSKRAGTMKEYEICDIIEYHRDVRDS